MSYRCRGCRQYYRDTPYRRINLGSVCSEECLTGITRRVPPLHPPKPDFGVPTEIRLVVLERDRRRCRYCGIARGLHLHHVHYRSEGIDHSAGNLITLCFTHHELVHSDKKYWQPICEAYVADAQCGHLTFLVDRITVSRPAATGHPDPK